LDEFIACFGRDEIEIAIALREEITTGMIVSDRIQVSHRLESSTLEEPYRPALSQITQLPSPAHTRSVPKKLTKEANVP